MLIVLDTNVLVSGLLTPEGYPGRVVDAVTSGAVQLALDDRILREWHQVLARPKFGFEPAQIEAMITSLRHLANQVVAPPLALQLPDPGDTPFAEVAIAVGADAIVTGNARDFVPPGEPLAVEVISPRVLIERIAGH